MLLHFAMAENTLGKIFPLFLCPPTPLLLLGSALLVGEVTRPRRGSNSLPGIPRMAVAIRRSPASPLDLTRFAQVEAASFPVLRHIPKRIPHPVGWGILFGAGDEESAEAPPAADEARRFRGSVPAVGGDSLRQPADTTVSAEAHAKKHHPLGWCFGAGDEARTRYLDLGKVALYQMSYARKRHRYCGTLVPPVGVEPTTRGFSVRCSTN